MSTLIKSLLIEKIVTGGYGLGRSSTGKVVLVHGVIPGERVDVQVFMSKKSYDLAFVTALSTVSDRRVKPACPLFMQCGGCTFQHLSYDDQVRYKKEIFTENWTQFFGPALPIPELTFFTATSPFSYRQRIRLHVFDDELCFYRHHSNKAIFVETCLLAREPINDCLHFLEDLDEFQDLKCNLRELVLHQNPLNNCCAVELFFNRKLRPSDKKRIVKILSSDLIQTIRVYGQSSELLETLGEEKHLAFIMDNAEDSCRFEMIPGDFCQVNMEQNKAMLQCILAEIKHDPAVTVLDLFCGLGNFSIPLAQQGCAVTGIDLKRSSIRSAERNCTLNSTKATFIRMSAAAGVNKQIKESKKYDVVILDPPRAGFKDGVHLLHKLGAQKILYIACDQQTQFRDIKTIIAFGYTIKNVYLFDMFPQTHHLESLVVLERA